MKQIVIDSSVVLKWYLVDEDKSQTALGLLDKYVSNKLDFLAPSLLEYEIVNGLVIAKKRGRIQEDRVLTAVEGFIDLEIKIKSISEFYPRILHYCEVYKRSAYDASYLALADEMGIPFITADEGLYNAVKKDLEWVRWIGTFAF